jgi:hypothetical protein
MAFAPAERNNWAAAGQVTTPIAINPCSMANNTFQHGESITYKLYYNWNFVWLSAGEVTFRVKETKDQYHLSAYGSTYKSYEWFYKVRDRYDTYVDKKTLLPVLSIRDVHEGKYRLYDKVTLDQQGKKAYSLRGKSKDVAQMSEYPIENCMHDILSIIYYTRNLDFANMPTGASFPIKIFMDKETWPLNVRYLGKEKDTKIRGLGKMNTIKFSPEVISGFVFGEGAQMTVWASDDQNKIPVLIESPVSVGSVKAVLKEYKGLRYPFNPAPEDD